MLLYMLRKTNKNLLLFLFFSVVTFPFYGQTTAEKKPLALLLTATEEKFEVRFTYATKNIENIYLESPSEVFSLAETLDYFNKNTPLLFTKVDNRFITITLKNSPFERCGIVTNSITGEPLEGATILTNNQNFAGITNNEGWFVIPPTIKANTVTISFIGFKKVQFPISELETETCLKVAMHPLIDKLDQVLLNYFTTGIEKQYNGSTTITTKNFGLLPGQIDNDVLQIIQVIPGVESVDETATNINIRGGAHNENLILWDDIRMYQNGHFFGLISAFNPDLTQKVTIYKNGTPARFGEGVSGVIDMKSKNDLTENITGGAGFNLINANAFISVPITKKLGLQVSGRKSINHLFESLVYTSYANRIFQDTEITNVQNTGSSSTILSDEDFSFFDFSAKLLWNISEKDKIRINFLTMENELDFTETISETNTSKTSILEQKSNVGSLSWTRNWSDKLKTTAFAYGTSYKLNSTNKDILTTQIIQQENEVLETGIKLDASIKFSNKVAVQTGYHFSETGIANTQDVNLPRFRFYEKKVLQSHIVFGNFEYTPNDNKTVINAGIRANYFPKLSAFLAEPRLSVHQKIGNEFAVEVLGEFKNQTTTQRIDFQSDFLGVEKNRWVLANENDIPIIKSKQASIGFLYNQHNWFINLEGFYKYVDGITSANQGFQNQFQFVKTTGNYTVKGAEFTLNKKMNSFSAWLSYTYSKNDYQFEELVPSEFANNIDVRNSFTLASTYTHKKFKASLGFNWHSGKPYTTPVEGNEIIELNLEEFINYNLPNAQRLPDYFRANLSAEYRWKMSERIETKFNFAILNIFNKENILNTRYTIIKDSNGISQVNKIDEISLGITPNISIQLLF
ncbi:MAG: TonB-dependent receptor [Flavobacteriaceae bacterium]|nr:TonB-dependent receptor [Flavobacteriaceae bacterium]